MMRNFKMLLAYDGSRYRGWQRLGDSDRTIQGKLEACLTALLQQPVQVSGAGRTDAGTHAIGQAASFRAETALPAAQLLRQLRARLPEDIGVLDLQEAAPRFHARLNAVCKTYRYRVWVSDQPCVFDRKYVYVCPGAYDLAAMRQAAETLLGSHDFLAFSANRPGKKSTVRRLGCAHDRKDRRGAYFYSDRRRFFAPHGTDPGGDAAGDRRGGAPGFVDRGDFCLWLPGERRGDGPGPRDYA